jgi:hypothetical protein
MGLGWAAWYIKWENSGGGNTALIEVQTDSYLGEDDIIRIEDDYRRRQRLPRGA